MKAYDLRNFFGGMSCYHDGEAMARALGIDNPERFSNRFMDDSLDGSKADPVMLPTKINQPSGEVEYCIGLRVWDALFLLSIMGRPRMDVGILTDSAHTLAKYGMQIIPRSLFPYSMVPMTRLDPVEKKQVVMHMQGQEDEDDDSIYVPRPLVLTRGTNSSILTRNFKPDYEGMICTKVLEDEMFMSEILEMSSDLGLSEWKLLPISEITSINIHWEYGVCYPLGRYIVPSSSSSSPDTDGSGDDDENNNDEDDDEEDRRSIPSSTSSIRMLEQVMERVSNVSQCALFLHPTRYSMMLWFMDAESRRMVEEAEENEIPDDWKPNMVLGHEFSLLPCLYPHGYPRHMEMHQVMGGVDARLLLTTDCPSIQDMQNRVFNLGFGPLPYFRRPGVLLHISPAHKDHNDTSKFQLGVIVCHRPNVHGCMYGAEMMTMMMEEEAAGSSNNPPSLMKLQQDERCYFCQDNPFYEVLFNFHSEDGDDWGPTCRIQQERAWERALPLGTKLLLKASALERIIPDFRFLVSTYLLDLPGYCVCVFLM